jgi:hypothetical protein
MKKLLQKLMAAALVLAAFRSNAADIVVTDDGSGTGTVTWTADNTYFLDGFIFVNSGQVLTIEAGTVIKGMPGTGADASALIVARGGQIFAQGTESSPIIFTFEGDALDGSIPYSTTGQWGGLIILGSAQLNSVPGETQIEGIPETESRGLYGGINDADNSGVLQYVSIRHGGTDIGAGNEINGLTLGGVGNATVIEHIEVFSNSDDGIEFFGGTARVKWASVAFCGDDSFDYDEGWRGSGQFWFTVQDSGDLNIGDRGGEHDGGTDPEDGMPYATPVIYNATFIGQGIAANNRAITIRDNAGGSYMNSIFANWAKGIDIENMPSGEDTYERFLDGQLMFGGNIFQDVVSDGDACVGQSAMASDLFKITMGTGWASATDSTNALTESLAAWQASFATNGNAALETGITYAFTQAGGLNPVPGFNYSGATPSTDAWYTAATYKGAFDPAEGNWLTGWSAIDNFGFFTPEDLPCGETIVITDSGAGTGTTTWRACNTYILDGFIFVNDGQCLTIEAGTVIKGMSGTGADASALIVARGGKIFAEGNVNNPIIFTFEGDPLDGSIPYTTNGQWGGLIILGSGRLNSTPGETQIEGIPETESRGLYGGDNDEDNSGIVKYVSIRHGGTDIGAGNEINGLTLGGVGSGTLIEFVEVVSNADDGVEFFGGTVNARNIAVAYPGDDSFDYDEGWRGMGQFWFTIQDGSDLNTGDRGGEHDGGTDPEDGTPYATPTIANATYMGQGVSAGNRALTFRDNAGGHYNNSIFYNWGKGIDIENLASGEDTYSRFESGELSFNGNCFYNVALEGVAGGSDIFKITMGTGWASDADSTAALTASSAAFQATFAVNDNGSEDPGIGYDFSGETPVLMVGPMNSVEAVYELTNPWFQQVDYKGAFPQDSDCSNENWLSGWSYLSTNDHLGCVTSVAENGEKSIDNIEVYPNPANTTLNYSIAASVSNATVELVDLTGKVVKSVRNTNMSSAVNYSMNVEDLANGIYVLKINAGSAVYTARVVIK